MAGIIKNQILKHLSRYVKNLSSDKINLSTFKGEGELSNLELDEIVMTDLLSLPTWMKITHATCNRVLIRIPWTKLKSVPIHLSLDEVIIRVEACEELRQEGTDISSQSPPIGMGKYGFVNKVIDGITATVNSVEIIFHSRAFESKVQISRIRVESVSPEWKRVDLSGTRLKDMERGECLIFKEMEWQTLRLESRSTSDSHLAPIRLLANQSKARIVIKKKISDSQVSGCRLSIILDDLLWVLTDSQILAALHFLNSLSGLVKQATEITQRVKAARKLESLPEYQAQQIQTTAMEKGGSLDKYCIKFNLYDVKETSYHFNCEKIDLHFCDDPGRGRSQHPDLRDGGALQLSLTQVMVDFYPYHLARGSRRGWEKYLSNNEVAQWLTQALNAFKISLIDTLSSSSLHSPLTRVRESSNVLPNVNPAKDPVTTQLRKLMSTCLVFKVQDLCLYRLTTSSKGTSPQPFISTFIERPKDLPVIHTEFTWFYYPGEICFPLPSPKIYAYLHPIQLHIDLCTILWLNSFLSNLQSAMSSISKSSSEVDYVDIRIELIMPKVVFECSKVYKDQKERPNSVHFQVSRLIFSNFRSIETGTLHQLTQTIEQLQMGDLVYASDFPSHSSDIPLLSQKFINHAQGEDKLKISDNKMDFSNLNELSLSRDYMWTEPRDTWYISLDPFWADFQIDKNKNVKGSKNSSVIYPFIDSVPLNAWIYMSQDGTKIHCLFNSSGENKIRVQINHYQYLFIMRMMETLKELSIYLTLDSQTILGKVVVDNIFTLIGYFKGAELSLVYSQESEGSEETVSEEELKSDACSLSERHHLSKNLFEMCVVGGSSPNLSVTVPFKMCHESMKSSLTNLASYKNISTPDSEVVSNWSNMSSDDSDHFVQLDVAGTNNEAPPIDQIPNDTTENNVEDEEIEVATEVEESLFNFDNIPDSKLDSIPIPTNGKISTAFTRAIQNTNDKFWVKKNEDSFSSSSPTQQRVVKLRHSSSFDPIAFHEKLNTEPVSGTIEEIKKTKLPRVNSADCYVSPLREILTSSTVENLEANIDFRNEEMIRVHTSAIVGIVDLLEDEIIPPILPMNMKVCGLRVEVIEDRPSSNSTSPGSLPLQLVLESEMRVSRDESGVFKIEGGGGNIGYGAREEEEEIRTLRNKLGATVQHLTRVQEEKRELERVEEESMYLRQLVQELQDRVEELQTEKLNYLHQSNK